MRWLSIVGARPQFVKLAPLCWALSENGTSRRVEHVVVHTGQHYDDEMSAVFFRELRLPCPAENLDVGSGTHGAQTAEIIRRLEPVLVARKPDWVILYGDTNSTLAGAIVAAKLPDVRIAHLEAGLRSFNRRMPEEVNRIAADHVSDLLLCPTAEAMSNLAREGLASRAVLTGDVMYDTFLVARHRMAEGVSAARPAPDGEFALATLHRQENTEDPRRLKSILRALDEIADALCPVILPLHPRTTKIMKATHCQVARVLISPPLPYHDMLRLQSSARMILTDSGGVQKEAYFLQRPCITLRDETEWVETLSNGCNVLVGADRERIVEAARQVGNAGPWLQHYGTGRAGHQVVDAIIAAS
jgi:UDP-GlcNAc3NAcA epimerase